MDLSPTADFERVIAHIVGEASDQPGLGQPAYGKCLNSRSASVASSSAVLRKDSSMRATPPAAAITRSPSSRLNDCPQTSQT